MPDWNAAAVAKNRQHAFSIGPPLMPASPIRALRLAHFGYAGHIVRFGAPLQAERSRTVMETTASSLPGVAAVESLSHTQIAQCYQCGKCTAGCPMAEHMDTPPTRLIRLLQLGDVERALSSDSIWQCVSCQTCATRCPKSVDCASILDALRQLAFERGTVSPEQRRTVIFQKAFLANIRRHGRLNEIELIALFKGEVFLRDRALPCSLKTPISRPNCSGRASCTWWASRCATAAWSGAFSRER